MAGTQPQSGGTASGGDAAGVPAAPPGGVPGGPAPADPEGRSRGWWWLLVIAAIVVVVLLVVRPWASTEATPTPTTTPPATTATPAPPSASPTLPVVPPAAEAVFDATTLDALFVTTGDLEADVPAAESGIERVDGGEMVWGLPAGSTVTPTTCTTAVTVVAQAPPAFGGRIHANDAMTFVQQVVVAGDPATARQAFAQLVTTVDACPTYSQANPGVDGATWTADPAIEGQGVYPSIIQVVVHAAEGDEVPAYRGHMLVGNSIVTWTASALADAGQEDALATLGDPETLTTMVQLRAQQAVLTLG